MGLFNWLFPEPEPPVPQHPLSEKAEKLQAELIADYQGRVDSSVTKTMRENWEKYVSVTKNMPHSYLEKMADCENRKYPNYWPLVVAEAQCTMASWAMCKFDPEYFD